MTFAKRLLVSLSSFDMFGQEARLRPMNIRSIEDHAVVRIGIRGRIVTIEVHRARIVTVVGIAKTISTTKTGVKDFHLNSAAKVRQKIETKKSKSDFLLNYAKAEGRGAPWCSQFSASTMKPTLASCSLPPSIHRGPRRSAHRQTWAQSYQRGTQSPQGHRRRHSQDDKHHEDRS